MKVREQLHKQADRTSAQLDQLWQEVRTTPLLTHGITCLVWAGTAAALSQAVISHICSPFGLGLVAAAGAGPVGLASLIGCCLGSLWALGIVGGLRCSAAAVLIFAVSFAFYDLRVYQRRWFMPLMAMGMDAATGVVYLAEENWIPLVVGLFGTEVVLVGLSCWCFRRALTSPFGSSGQVEEDFFQWFQPTLHLEPVQKGCLLLLTSIGISALSDCTVASLSLGRILALTATLTLGAYRSLESGLCVGILFGFAVDLTGQTAPYCTALFALSGLAAGCATRRRRLLIGGSCLAAGGLISVIWLRGSELLPSEALVASLLFFLLPPRLFRRLRLPPHPKPLSPAVPAVAMLKGQLTHQATAFDALHDHLCTALQQAKPDRENQLLLFTRAADRICSRCALRSRCWQQEYTATCRWLRQALPPLLERGQAAPSDFPAEFRDRCAHFPAFLAACSVEISNLLAHQQYQARVWENRAAVCRQYGTVAQLLHTAARRLSQQPEPLPDLTRKLEEHLRVSSTTARGLVAKTPQGRTYIELWGDDLVPFDNADFLALAIQLTGTLLRRGELTCDDTGQRLTLLPQEPFAVAAGVAARPRTGNAVSGDTCCWFKGDDGVLRVILCDGMGSGSGAARESRLMVTLLEDLLRADLPPEEALSLVNEAMSLRCDLGGGFSTVDLLTVDLFQREGVLYKLGAAPSYLCRSGHVSRIAGGALPVGLCDTQPDITRFSLESQDLLLLVSDGISDGTEDEWLRTCLQQGGQLSTKSLACAILQQSEEHAGGRDDRSVVVLRLNQRV